MWLKNRLKLTARDQIERETVPCAPPPPSARRRLPCGSPAALAPYIHVPPLSLQIRAQEIRPSRGDQASPAEPSSRGDQTRFRCPGPPVAHHWADASAGC